MASVTGLIAGLAICPEVVTPAADMQMLEHVMTNLLGIRSADRIAGTNSTWMALGQMCV